jgi:tetratricopeptide (TPR) repeat protein
MAGVRNGKSTGTPEPAAAHHEELGSGMPDMRPEEEARDAVDRHLRSARGLLREGGAAQAFGQLARASRTEAMTPRLAAALVRFALLAGTEAAAIILLDATQGRTPAVRLAVRRQLTRVLRRVGQIPRAIAALEAMLAEFPEDRRARRILRELEARGREAPQRAAGGPAGTAGESVTASGVMAKLPTRKAGGQVAAVWDENAGSREVTQVQSGSDRPAKSQPSEHRERTAVAFPSVLPTTPHVSGSQPRGVPGPKTETELPAVEGGAGSTLTAPHAKPEVESPVNARKSAPETPVASSSSRPGSEASKTLTEMPVVVSAALSTALPEPRTGPTAGQAADKGRPAPRSMSPAGTQEVAMADLEAALTGSRPAASTPARAEAPPLAQPPPPAARADGRGMGGEAGPVPRPEDAGELARSQKLEAQLIARKAWRELAQLYLKRADQAKDTPVRAEALTRLAEVMENELQDPAGAARMYREIVDLTGDRAALREQVRLLSTRGDASLVRRALDEAIQRAGSAQARAGALLTRGERWLHMGEPGKARADFEAAEALVPGLLPVLAGLLSSVSDAERPATAARLRTALEAAPRRTPDRVEALRMLAQAAEAPLGDLRMAQWAWTEVLAENSESEQARRQLVALARKLGDPMTLGQLLRAQLARESRGPAARQARLELVSTLEALGDDASALDELRQAVRYEPGHKEAWLLLVDRLIACGNMSEAVWALEHAATAMEDMQERERAWERLARLWRDVLSNPERAQIFARRAESLRHARQEREVPPPEPPRGAPPRRESSGPKSPLIPVPATLSLPPSGIEALAVEDTPTTDPDASPAAVEGASPGAEGSGAKSRKGAAASRKTGAVEAAPVPASRRGPRAAQTDKARDAPAVKGGAADVRPTPKFPAAPRSPASRGDTPVPPALSPQSVSDDESSVERTLALGASHRAPASPAPTAAAEGRPPPRGKSGMDLLAAEEPMDLGSAPVPETRFLSWEAPPSRMEPVRRTVHARPDGAVSVPSSGNPATAKPPASEAPPRGGPGAVETRESPAVSEPSPNTEPNAFKHLRERPLDAKLYRESGEYFDSRGDTGRATLMREIADALDGLEFPAAPRFQRPPLTPDERAGLRHPGLRTPSGELLACAGIALCRLFPAQGRAAGTSKPLRAASGPGAPAVLDTLRTTARLLDVPLPELVLAEDDGPPFTAVHAGQPRLLVGRLAIHQPLSAAELRFHAGRALLSLSPDLMALRALKGVQFLRALALLSSILKDPNASSPEARVVRESLSPRELKRAVALLDEGTRNFNAPVLADAARDSANRAGLVACGSVGPALAVLRARRGQDSELVELLRFAASERYFELRATR